MIKTVIFDLDGTLADTIGGIASGCNYVLSKRGFRSHPIDAYKSMVGNGLPLTIFRALPDEIKKDYYKNHPEYYEAVSRGLEGEWELEEDFLKPYLEDLLGFYLEHPLMETSLYPHIWDVLDLLDEKGVQWGIHTNKTKGIAQKIADHYFGDRSYLGLAGPDEATERKPGIGGALQLLGQAFNRDEVLYVGDTEVDVKTARNLGVKVASVSWGFRSLEHLQNQNPDFIIHHPQELLDLLD